LVEELVIQLYRDKLETFIGEMNKPEVKLARQNIPVAIGILSGVKPKPISMKQIQTQVAAVRQQGLAGVSFFFYESLWKLSNESVAKRKQGFKQMFS
jgi:uncharacterized lipoprotein YddW (UPF0748 family)